MLRNMNQSAAGARICGTYRCGVLASEIPASGSSGPSPLYNDILAGDPVNCEYRLEILTWPSAGALRVREPGDFEFIGAPDGVYVCSVRVHKTSDTTGTSYEDTTLTLIVGAGLISVGLDLALSYTVAGAMGTAVGASLALSYQVLTAVGENLPLSYQVVAVVGLDLTLLYGVLSDIEYARAPAGPGYSPRRKAQQQRPAATQRNCR